MEAVISVLGYFVTSSHASSSQIKWREYVAGCKGFGWLFFWKGANS